MKINLYHLDGTAPERREITLDQAATLAGGEDLIPWREGYVSPSEIDFDLSYYEELAVMKMRDERREHESQRR